MVCEEGMVSVQPRNPNLKQLDQTMGQTVPRLPSKLRKEESAVPGPPDPKKTALTVAFQPKKDNLSPSPVLTHT